MSAVQRIRLDNGSIASVAQALSPPPPDRAIASQVATLLQSVRDGGDDAVVELVRQFDAPQFVTSQLRIPAEQIASAAAALPTDLRDAILFAAEQVRAFARATRPGDQAADLPVGQRVTMRSVPVAAAGVYVPGGRASYPSSLVMAVVPAQVAGVERIAVCSPPGADGQIAPVILGTAGLLGVDEVYAMGGPAAIAALAYGTETIASVDVIAGPGNAWVQEAKRQVYGAVGIDGIAGPSEIIVIADDSADSTEVASDLLAQAEHGPDSPAIVLSTSPRLLDGVADELAQFPLVGATTLIDVDDLETAMRFAEQFAPEHLQIMTADARERADTVRCAGCVFVGPNGATAFGDYVAGSNHILPTGGAARFASAVSAATFMRRLSVVDIPDSAVPRLAGALAVIANAEGFTHHGRSAQIRAARVERQETR